MHTFFAKWSIRITICTIFLKNWISCRNLLNEILTVQVIMKNKIAELSQRWPRDASYIWCPENFRESLSTPTTTFPEIFHGLLFQRVLWMRVQNLKLVALPVPEIIVVSKNLGSPWNGYANAPFHQNFEWGFVRIDPLNVHGKFEVRLRSWDNIDWSFGGLRTPNLQEQEAVGGREW